MVKLIEPRWLPDRWASSIALCFVVATIAVSPTPALGEEKDPRWNLGGFTPGLIVTMGVHGTEMFGFVRASDSADMDLPGRPPDDSEKEPATPMLHVGLTVDSPPISDVLDLDLDDVSLLDGNVKIGLDGIALFGGADYFTTFPPERFAANEASPSGFLIREDVIADIPEEAIEGQGSQTEVQTGRHAWGVTAGFSVPFEIMGVKFWLRPGASYMRYRWDVTGLILEAIKVETVPTVIVGREFRGVELKANGKLYQNGVGPYLGLDVEPIEFGPTLIGFYAEGAYYQVLGDRDLQITANRTYDDGIANLPSPETYQGRFGINLSRSFWRAGAGFRIYLKADD